MKLGSKENPCRNNHEIDKIMRGMLNCKIYTLNTFEISEENLEQAKARNIKFVGLVAAYLKAPKINIPKIPIYSISMASQVQKAVDVEVSKTAEQFKIDQEQYKTKYLGRWI